MNKIYGKENWIKEVCRYPSYPAITLYYESDTHSIYVARFTKKVLYTCRLYKSGRMYFTEDRYVPRKEHNVSYGLGDAKQKWLREKLFQNLTMESIL